MNSNNKFSKLLIAAVVVVLGICLIMGILSFAFKAGDKAKEGAEQQVNELFESGKSLFK